MTFVQYCTVNVYTKTEDTLDSNKYRPGLFMKNSGLLEGTLL